MRRSSRRRALAALAAAATLAGCGRIVGQIVPGQGPPPQLYTLTPKSTHDPDLPQVGWQLTLEVPFASAALNTTRIAIQPSATSFEYYARASWTDVAPVMVQTLMIESFENSGKIVAVGRESIGLRSDFILKTELREFQAEAIEGGRVRVKIDAKLVKMPQRTIIAATEIGHMAPAEVGVMDSVIMAFDEALGKVLKRLVEWTLVSGETAWRREPRRPGWQPATRVPPEGPASPQAAPR